MTPMKLNKVLSSILKTAVYIMDQTAGSVDRASDRASELAENAKDMVYPEADHTLRNVISFVAGVGVGVGAGLLLAPASGADLRNQINDKVQDISNRVKGKADAYATGTDLR
jgi:hypothetical protein